jgi:DNA-binding transcriptional LysR family regulator
MDKFTSMKVFRQVVESGSFVGAADRLGISTPMVSKHVMAIEKRVQLRLLNRNSHRLSLTEPGKLYFERCKSILEDLQETELELESLRAAPSGTLRIALCDTCIPGLGLAKDLAEYRRRWPQVVLDISFAPADGDLAQESHDLAFRVVGDDALPPDRVARLVRRVPFRLAASRDYLERHGVPKAPDDLRRHDFITAGGPQTLSLEGPLGTLEIPLGVGLRCRTMADVAIAAASGVGLALLPAALCSDPAFAGVLRPVLTEFRLKDSGLYLLYRTRKHLPLKARNFIDLVLASGASTGEQRQAASAASMLQYPPRTAGDAVLEKHLERSRPSIEPYRTQRGELDAVRPAAGSAH